MPGARRGRNDPAGVSGSPVSAEALFEDDPIVTPRLPGLSWGELRGRPPPVQPFPDHPVSPLGGSTALYPGHSRDLQEGIDHEQALSLRRHGTSPVPGRRRRGPAVGAFTTAAAGRARRAPKAGKSSGIPGPYPGRVIEARNQAMIRDGQEEPRGDQGDRRPRHEGADRRRRRGRGLALLLRAGRRRRHQDEPGGQPAAPTPPAS